MYDPVADMDRLMDAAKAAPSVLNTQPWLFQIVANDRINLRAQRDRWLQNIDPERRELAISCGAALFNFRLALRNAGHDHVVWLMPDEDNDPDLLASVEIVTGRVHPPTVTEQRLYEAIPRRHTNRQPFEKKVVGFPILVELERVAWQERAHLWLLHRQATRTLLAEIEKANGEEKNAKSYWGHEFQKELEEYTNEPRLREGLGIPSEAFGPLPANGRHFRNHDDATGAPLGPGVPYRDLGFKYPQPTGPGPREKKPFEKHTRLMWLATDTNTPTDWLRAGQGLQRVLLTATRYHVVASFYTQPLEPSNANGRPSHPPWPWPKFPQMIMRIGHCNSVTAMTPRLPNNRLWEDSR
jgi:Putative TM nitroreductase